jgi:predicted NBD/HSP70 family sugar kinase
MIDMGLPSYVEGMTGDKSLSKAINRGLLLNILRAEGSASRASLAKQSGLNKATVSSQINELIEMGIVKETGTGQSGLGRKPVMLEIAGNSGYTLGISIITESLHVTVMDLAQNIILENIIPVQEDSSEKIFTLIQKTISKIEKKLPPSFYGLAGVGIAVPGIVDREGETIVLSARFGWINVTLRSLIEKKYKGILHLGNDAALAAIAERERYNKESEDLVCVFMDEGIGSGAYINGSVHYGYNGKFGEVGHMTIQHDGPRCPCGNYGCWDLLGSEAALRRNLSLAENTLAGDKKIPSQETMLLLAKERPSWSKAVFDDFVAYSATGVVSLINAFAPSSLIINSDVLRASDELYGDFKKAVEERIVNSVPECEIKLSTLGKTAPSIGACIAVMEKFYHTLVIQ